ncbi:hypothetical protein FN846DRAFT_970851 [Sphaerosporella brunnea]|uniref:Uncharacterized protein n=1 Tax=Sphaerosporella brunnea TaxID=1250544 RepID=A0A5J5EJ34_9PEZI|nr:hypothetical protein FN846DRAFT_970851 [Sphaerosporella brunnea]
MLQLGNAAVEELESGIRSAVEIHTAHAVGVITGKVFGGCVSDTVVQVHTSGSFLHNGRIANLNKSLFLYVMNLDGDSSGTTRARLPLLSSQVAQRSKTRFQAVLAKPPLLEHFSSIWELGEPPIDGGLAGMNTFFISQHNYRVAMFDVVAVMIGFVDVYRYDKSLPWSARILLRPPLIGTRFYLDAKVEVGDARNEGTCQATAIETVGAVLRQLVTVLGDERDLDVMYTKHLGGCAWA